ncbi:MAG: DUF3052 domain-containing protein [Actinomycetota bacterium]|nr:DUF3052 domain-containing protein [Actinomycetota bacterium]
MTAGYSATLLPKKLGIREGFRVTLLGAPAGFDLGQLPAGVRVVRRRGGADAEVILLFCPRLAVLADRLAPLADSLARTGALWVCWPKKASGLQTDLGEGTVRERGLAVGLVDVKVAAIDDTWSGLKFVRRLADR